MSFVLAFWCPLLTVRLKTMSRTSPSSQLKWRFSARRWVLRMARNPLRRLQLWIRAPSRIWSRSSKLERRRTLLPSLDDPEVCVTPFGFSKNLCCSPHLRLFPTQPLPQLQNSAKQSPKSQRRAVEVKASTSQRVRVCDHLDPMESLEVEPLGVDQQELWRANYAKLLGRFTARRLGVYDGTACRHACPSDYPLPRTVHRLRPGHPVLATRAEGVRLLARVPSLTAFSLTSACRPVHGKSRGSGHVTSSVGELLGSLP